MIGRTRSVVDVIPAVVIGHWGVGEGRPAYQRAGTFHGRPRLPIGRRLPVQRRYAGGDQATPLDTFDAKVARWMVKGLTR